MLALGLCNLFGSFSRSMPTTGSFTRTAVNNASGVKTPMGGVITGCLVLLACGLLTSTFQFIPKATLAAVIIVAMYYMLELHIFTVLWRTKSKDPIKRKKITFNASYPASSQLFTLKRLKSLSKVSLCVYSGGKISDAIFFRLFSPSTWKQPRHVSWWIYFLKRICSLTG